MIIIVKVYRATVPELLNSDMVGRCPEITMPPTVEIVCVEVGGRGS